MTYTGYGRVIKGVGGLFTVRMFDRASRLHNEAGDPMPLDGMTVSARGRGVLHKKGALLVGDLVEDYLLVVLTVKSSAKIRQHKKVRFGRTWTIRRRRAAQTS